MLQTVRETKSDRRVRELGEVRVEIVDDAVLGPRQREAADQQNEHQNVRKQRREPRHLQCASKRIIIRCLYFFA